MDAEKEGEKERGGGMGGEERACGGVRGEEPRGAGPIMHTCRCMGDQEVGVHLRVRKSCMSVLCSHV